MVYQSQINEIYSALITPAISGIALIGGLSDSLLSSEYTYHSLYEYQKQKKPAIINLSDAKRSATNEGYKELIQYKAIDDKLVKKVFKLDDGF